MTIKLLTCALNVQSDVMSSRQRARQIAEHLGFDGRDQTRIATSVSEIARNAFRYAGGGSVQFELLGETPPQVLQVRVSDDGPGIAHLDEVMEGTYHSTTGMGIGLIGSKRLMDQWEIHSEPGKGTTVTLGKLLPHGSTVITPVAAGKLVAKLAALPQTTTLAEVQAQNVELLAALAELQDKQDKLVEVARELEDTNRGVVALYAELDEKAMHLRRADEMKSRFLSNMSHEFRTPLNSVRALSTMLLSGADGVLGDDQQTQVKFISRAAEDLSELVNDLLDLAKIEAGKIDVRPARFDVAELFSALRGMLRPLLVSDAVDLVFHADEGLPPLFTDESKVSQILRNFISNALKFTERGSVAVSARLAADHQSVLFEVADTGIGIAMEDMELIFEEFGQVPSALQRRVKGTGLGLPLCRKLATLLGGEVAVTSEPGRGSCFSARIPVSYQEPSASERAAAAPPVPLPADGNWVLVVEDEPGQRLLYEKFLRDTSFDVIGVATLAEAEDLLARARPAAVILDIFLPGEEQRTWRWLAQAKAHDNPLPVIVVSNAEDRRKALSLGADAYFDKPLARADLIAALERINARSETGLALIIDDDAAARYVIRRSLRRALKFEEARDGPSGLALAATCHPKVIFLDLSMPGMHGDEVLGRLKGDPATAHIPVIIVTSHEIDAALRERLGSRAHAILQKKDLSMETLERTLDGIGGSARMTPRASVILNVDDNEATRYVKSRTLRRAGYEVVEAGTVAEALRGLADRPPDLVLLDVRLPDGNGRDLCARIKADASLASVLVLQTSASHVESAHRVASLDAGADGYLVEPIAPEELIANVRALLRLRQAESERQAAIEALREADRRKDEFLAMLAHELRNPLAPIRNAVEIMRLSTDAGTQAKARELIGRQTEHLGRLVDDLLEMSRITQRKLVLQPRIVSLRSLVDAALEVARAYAEKSGQELQVSMPGEEVWLDVDPVRISQVIGNLLHNASKFTPRGGGVSLDARLVPEGVELQVGDTGVGIAPELLKDVFDLFSQADRSLDRAQGGLGIGLSLVRGLVEMHGGRVAAQSEGLGKGSVFRVVLPRSRIVGSPSDPTPEQGLGPSTGNRRILVVEDNPDSAEAMVTLLRELGHDVAMVGDGTLAVGVARQFDPDVILLDIGLPGIDGYELARRLRANEVTGRACMIAITGYGQPADRERAVAAGFDQHLVKPVDPTRLAAAVNELRSAAI